MLFRKDFVPAVSLHRQYWISGVFRSLEEYRITNDRSMLFKGEILDETMINVRSQESVPQIVRKLSRNAMPQQGILFAGIHLGVARLRVK